MMFSALMLYLRSLYKGKFVQKSSNKVNLKMICDLDGRINKLDFLRTKRS